MCGSPVSACGGGGGPLVELIVLCPAASKTTKWSKQRERQEQHGVHERESDLRSRASKASRQLQGNHAARLRFQR
eukprot:2450320-Rhodomonas_salina.1